MNNKLLITTRIGWEELGIDEVGNILYPRTEYHPEKTRYPGVIIASIRMNVLSAYKILINNILSSVMRIYPMRTRLEDWGSIVSDIGEAWIRCELRGKRMECRELIEKAANKLKSMGTALKSSSPYILHIQGADSQYGYTLLPKHCENYSKIIVDVTLRRKCTDFAGKYSKSLL